MSVDGDVGDVGEDLRRAIPPFLEGEEFRRRVDELGRVGVVEEARVLQQVLDKGDVGVLVDAMSYPYLVGAQIDYQEDLQGSKF
ncbi:MAG: hypothetical protein AAFV09_00365, partial [Pseudomonadota bacterium]